MHITTNQAEHNNDINNNNTNNNTHANNQINNNNTHTITIWFNVRHILTEKQHLLSIILLILILIHDITIYNTTNNIIKSNTYSTHTNINNHN